MIDDINNDECNEETVVADLSDLLKEWFLRIHHTFLNEPPYLICNKNEEHEKAVTYFENILNNQSLNVDCLPESSSSSEFLCLLSYINTCQFLFPCFQKDPLILPWDNIDGILNELLKDPTKGDYCWSPILTSNFLEVLLRNGFIPLCDNILGFSNDYLLSTHTTYSRVKFLSKELEVSMESVNDDKHKNVTTGSPIDASNHHNGIFKSQYETNEHNNTAFLEQKERKKSIVFLLPKLNRQRCILNPKDVHISRKARKRAKHFYLTTNHHFSKVIEGCVRQHGTNWLYPPLQQCLKELHLKTTNKAINENSDFQVCSIEVLFNNNLVAGELGVINGASYLSLTGFSAMDSAGTVQLVALGRLLKQREFDLWDLGMWMPYKKGLGAFKLPRQEFFPLFRHLREKTGHTLQIDVPINCKTILDYT